MMAQMALKMKLASIKKQNEKAVMIRLQDLANREEYKYAKFIVQGEKLNAISRLLTAEEIDMLILVNPNANQTKLVNEPEIKCESENFGNNDTKIKFFLTPEKQRKGSGGLFTSDEDNTSDLTPKGKNEAKIGGLSVQTRLEKIAKYKLKLAKRRARCPLSRKFGGRSKAANSKIRINGKFATKEMIAQMQAQEFAEQVVTEHILE